jgi:hypothetical protein
MIFLIDKSIETYENVNSIEKKTKDQIIESTLRNAKDIPIAVPLLDILTAIADYNRVCRIEGVLVLIRFHEFFISIRKVHLNRFQQLHKLFVL